MPSLPEITMPGILRMKQIRLWIAVILVITVVGALFLVTTSKINNKARAYTLGQYRIKDMKVLWGSRVAALLAQKEHLL